MVYRTFALDVRNEGIRRATVMVHGAGRNADHYFTTVTSAAFIAGALEDTVVISPRLTACNDNLCLKTIDVREVGALVRRRL